MPIKIVITDSYHGHALAKLKAEVDCTLHHASNLRPTADELRDCEVLLIRSRTRIESNLLKEAPKLKLVVSATSGYDHIDWVACQKQGVTVAHAPEANATAAAELTIGLMMTLARKLRQSFSAIERNHWRSDELRGESLAGKALGIIGLGRVGKKVARIARAMDMKLLAFDPYVDESTFVEFQAERLGLSEILVASDILTLHVPLTRETLHLLNHQTLPLMNPECLVINVSRGPVIDESELTVALDEGHVRGAALDVFEKEPLIKESRLRGRSNVVLTPHIGAFTEEALEKASMEAVQRVIEFMTIGRTKDCLPLNTPWFNQLLKA